jgi:hypothetical protein
VHKQHTVKLPLIPHTVDCPFSQCVEVTRLSLIVNVTFWPTLRQHSSLIPSTHQHRTVYQEQETTFATSKTTAITNADALSEPPKSSASFALHWHLSLAPSFTGVRSVRLFFDFFKIFLFPFSFFLFPFFFFFFSFFLAAVLALLLIARLLLASFFGPA